MATTSSQAEHPGGEDFDLSLGTQNQACCLENTLHPVPGYKVKKEPRLEKTEPPNSLISERFEPHTISTWRYCVPRNALSVGFGEDSAMTPIGARAKNFRSRADYRSQSGYEAKGGGFNNALGRLRTLELVQGRGELRATDNLLDAAAH